MNDYMVNTTLQLKVENMYVLLIFQELLDHTFERVPSIQHPDQAAGEGFGKRDAGKTSKDHKKTITLYSCVNV